MAHVQASAALSITADAGTSFTRTLTGVVVGNYLILVGGIGDAGNEIMTIASVTDDQGNTYTIREGVATIGGGNQRSRPFVVWAKVVTGGTVVVTITLANTSAGANRYGTIGLLEKSGVAASTPEDTFDSNDEVDITTNDVNAGPITTSQADTLIVGAAMIMPNDVNVNWASPSSWTNRYRENDSSTRYGVDVGDWEPGAVQTTYTPQWTHDNESASEGAAVVVALKLTAGGGGGGSGANKTLGSKLRPRAFAPGLAR